MLGEEPRTAVREMCSICQFPVGPDEERTQCPHCGLPFHAECWEQNYGCSAYGCPQVNALKPAGDQLAPGPTASGTPSGSLPGPSAVPGTEPFPWDFLYLGASALTALGSLFSYGVPSAVLLLVVAVIFVARKGKKSWVVFLLTLLVCQAGLLGGFVASYYL